MTTTICPACSGPKTRRAQLCERCRRRAIANGVDAVLHPALSDPPTPGMLRAYHGKCGSIALAEGVRPQVVKQRALEYAAALLGRPIESSKQLAADEMSELLDWLDEQMI